jgi:3-hydroxyisobutyrate dehydrogenase
MVGGTRSAYERATGLLSKLSTAHQYMGGPGSGQHTKIAGQILGASTILGVAESLSYSQKAGLDMTQVISVLEKGSVGSWLYSNLGPKIIAEDFAPGFAIKHFIKDMGIALDEAKRQELFLPGLALVQQLYIAATALGQKEQGIQGLFKTLHHMNNKDSQP